jgi:hypothetical protein
MDKSEESDWMQHKLLIMDSVNRLESQQKDTSQEIKLLASEVHTLKIETALWSGFAALVPALIVIVIAYLKFHNLLKEKNKSCL